MGYMVVYIINPQEGRVCFSFSMGQTDSIETGHQLKSSGIYCNIEQTDTNIF